MALSNTAIPVEYGKFRDAVLNGEIRVNREVSMEMNRIDYLIESPEYYYDDEAIQGYINFCENELTLSDGSDLWLLPTFRLWAESALSWFYFVEEPVYNPMLGVYENVVRKKRLINKQYLIVGRGAAKSMYASTMHSYFLNVDATTTRNVCVAPTMKQAEEVVMPMKTAISRARGPFYKFLTQGSKFSNNYFLKQKLASTKNGIENFLTNSVCEIRPMSVDKLQGLGTKLATVDEWLSGNTKEDVINALEEGCSKVDDWLIIAISSEGNVRNGIGDSIKMELMDILKGDYWAPHVSIWYYRLDDVREIRDPSTWVKAQPNIGATVSYETYQKEVAKMEAVPSSRNEILAKRFGIPVEGISYFFKYEDTLLHPPQNFDHMVCSMGGDLSQGDDFCAFTFLFPMSDGYLFGVKTRAYVSESKVRKLPSAMRKKYDEFINEGSLVVMDSPVLDMEEVYEDLEQYIVLHDYTVMTVGYDPYNADWFIQNWIRNNGEYGITVVRQGARTESVPLGELGVLADERRLLFDEELMKFAMGNAISVKDTNDNMKLSRKRSIEKIDNVSALLDAYVAYLRNREAFE